MKNKELVDISSDSLMSACGPTTGTGLAGLLGTSVSHDRIQRLLAQERLGSAELWQVVKPYGRQIEPVNGVIIRDDSIAEKPYTADNAASMQVMRHLGMSVETNPLPEPSWLQAVGILENQGR